MSQIQPLSAAPRDRAGKGAARAERRNNRVPAVIYGGKQDPETVSLDYALLLKTLNKGKFLSTLFELDVDGKKQRVIPRDVQYHPVNDKPLHVDFLRLGKDARINVFVPVHFLNEGTSPGLKKGGVLNIVRHEVELMVSATDIPDALEVDLNEFDVGDTVHISSIKLPEGAAPIITDRDFTVATIATPSGGLGDDSDGAEGEGDGEEDKKDD